MLFDKFLCAVPHFTSLQHFLLVPSFPFFIPSLALQRIPEQAHCLGLHDICWQQQTPLGKSPPPTVLQRLSHSDPTSLIVCVAVLLTGFTY